MIIHACYTYLFILLHLHAVLYISQKWHVNTYDYTIHINYLVAQLLISESCSLEASQGLVQGYAQQAQVRANLYSEGSYLISDLQS